MRMVALSTHAIAVHGGSAGRRVVDMGGRDVGRVEGERRRPRSWSRESAAAQTARGASVAVVIDSAIGTQW